MSCDVESDILCRCYVGSNNAFSIDCDGAIGAEGCDLGKWYSGRDNVQQTLAITNKTYIMFEGNILKEGIPEDLANDQEVRKAYLGENFRFEKF